jgi:signal transduction histidine kinase/ABC-type multidrug transport system ATPase subunit
MTVTVESAVPNTAAAPGRPRPAPRLELSGLSVNLGPVGVISEVDLRVDPGELVVITGEPGSGKTTLVRCIAGDLTPASGEVSLDGQRVTPGVPAGRQGIAVVWQDLELCDNLDVAGALLLGQERRGLMFSPSRFRASAAALLERLQLPIADASQPVSALSGGQRQLLALARAVSANPRLLVLDEPTAALGAVEAAHAETLIRSLRDEGASVLLATRDIELIYRLADRIVVLRHGRVAADVSPRETHPDDIVALRTGQPVDTSARRQLTRLHGLTGRLVSTDPSSSLSLIVSALASALGTDRACIHVVAGGELVCAASLGFAQKEIASFSRLELGPDGGPVGRAAQARETVVDRDVRAAWPGLGPAAAAAVASTWSAPVVGLAGAGGVITVFRGDVAAPERDQLDLLTLYAGYTASAVERDRLLDQVTARNRVLETIREMLQTLAGPVTVGEEGLPIALGALRRGLQADEVALLSRPADGPAGWRAYTGPLGTDPETMSDGLRAEATAALASRRDGRARSLETSAAGRVLAVPFNAPAGPTVLAAAWTAAAVSDDATALIEDAAHSLNLALEREEAGLAHQEAAALRRSRELQRGFLSRLSHELRTPLTAIRGYASSLMAPDVTWDAATQSRFLETIAAESARLGRLVDDLLDFSSIELGVMRLQPDWCDLTLVLGAAVSCLPQEWSADVEIGCDPLLPPIWADHDRLEQLFVNLMGNAFRHNAPGTRVRVRATEAQSGGEVELTVDDDGGGFPAELASAPFDSTRRPRSRSAGAGLGLSIARGIVEAHGGTIALEDVEIGTRFRIRLPVEAPSVEARADAADPVAEPRAYA